MATTPNNPNPQNPQQPTQPQQQPQQPQQQPVSDPNQMTPQQVRDIAAGIPQQPQQQQPAQQGPIAQIPGLPPIEQGQDGMLAMRLPTGQVYKGRDHNELLAAMAQAQINASQRITELGTTNERLQAGIAAITGQPGAQPGQSQFDRAVYMELQAVDPIMAQNYLDQHRFGLANVNDVVPYYTRTFQSADEFRTVQTVNQFRVLAPDFPGTEQAVNEVMGFMKNNNIPFSAPNLKLVHDGMVKAGRYQPLQMQPQGQFPQPSQMQQPGQPQQQQQQPNPALYDPNPQGNYAFGPNGFGSQFQAPPAPAQPTVATPPPAAPNMPYATYPTMPNVPRQAIPMPMPQVTPTNPNMPPNQPANEGTMNMMDTNQLRAFIESNLTR